MLRSKLVNSLLQIVTQSSLPGVLRSTRLKRKQSRCGTEQLEVRQLLTGDFESAVRLGSTGFDEGTAITTDASGNVYTTGYFSGTVDFDPGVGISSLESAGASDVFVTKSDSAGNLLWAKRIGGAGEDKASSLAMDSLGNVYVAGAFNGTSDFDPGSGVSNLTSVGVRDAFIVKLSGTGSFAWAKRIGGVDSLSEVILNGLSIDRLGNVCSAGAFKGTVDFDPGSGVENRVSADTDTTDGYVPTDAFVLKLSSSGGYTWSRTWGATDLDFATDIALDDADNILISGFFMGSVNFDSVTSLVSSGNEDAFVSKLDSSGILIWVRRTGGGAVDMATSIDVDRFGNIYTAGAFRGTVDFDPGGGVHNLTSVEGSDGFLQRLDNGGNFVWGRRLDAVPTDIAVNAAGNIFLTGSFRGSIGLDLEGGSSYLASAGGLDVFVIEYNSAGSIRWGSQLGGALDENEGKIAVDRSGSIYTTGSFTSVADFDPGIGVTNLTSAGLSDIFVSKLSPDMLYTHPNANGELRLRRNGTMLELWVKALGTFGEFVLFETHPLAAIRSVKVKGSNAGSNVFSLDFAAGGSFSVDQGIQFTAGTNAGDSVQVIGVGNEGVAYRPSSEAGSGKFVVYGKEVAFTGVEYTALTTVQALSVEPQGSADVLTVGVPASLGGPITSDITGTTGGGTIVPLLFTNVRDLTIDTGVSDAALAQSNDTVTFNAGSYETQGLKNVIVRTGKGNDTLRVNSADLGLPESGGSFWYLGGAGSDLLQTTGDANWDLNETRLASSGGGRLQFDETERVSITGGVSNNHINASQFTGTVILDGAGGNDLLRGGAGSDTLFGGNGNDRLFGGAGDDVLHGQDGNDSVWGDDGLDTLNGNAGNDLLWGGNDDDVVSGHTGNDVMMGGSGRDTLNAGEHNDRLYGEAGDDVLFGGTGNDQLWGGDDDDLLSSDDGDDELWGGNGNDQLDGGGGSDQVFGDAGRDILNGGSDMDLLDGGSGSDRLNGDGGIDLYVLQGTENTEELWLNFVSANSALFRRRPRGLVSTLELDTITMDASDEFQILALGGDDNLLVDALFTQLGQLDGGAGDDLSGAPAGWTKISC